jgi:hypothetical protein
VARLVKRHLLAPGEPERSEFTPARIGDGLGDLHAFSLKLVYGAFDVVAHQKELMPAVLFGRIGRMHAELCRR